jgi:hypothetical protein
MDDLHEKRDELAEGTEQTKMKRSRLSGPLRVGLFFAALAVFLTLLGLWRAHNLSLRNVLLGIALCGGTWGLVSWAIAAAAAQVEEDVASRGDEDG